MKRRHFLKLALASSGVGAGALGYSTLIEPGQLCLERVTVDLPDLPAALEGMRIAVLSDFHLHPFTELGFVKRALALANSTEADLVVLLGDFVDASVDAIDELAPALSGLQARLGVFAVLGNHDHWKGAGVVRDALRKHGVQVLRNSGVSIAFGTGELYLGGLESAWAGRPNLTDALAARRGKAWTMLLVHEPDFADYVPASTRVGLQLSGHTHGGQVRLPLLGALALPSWGKRYDAGLYRLGDMALYTNRGIGLVDIPVRFNCPPEVTELTLRRAREVIPSAIP